MNVISGEAISKSPLNHSHSKQMYSFPKTQRFKMNKPHVNDQIYSLPSVRMSRTTTQGFGTKYDFTKENRDKSQTFYNTTRGFDPSTSQAPKYTFGVSRSKYEKVYCEANKMLDRNVPGPGLYKITKPFGADASKFTMVGKGNDKQLRTKSSEPGPGQYKHLTMTVEGKYPDSKFRNTATITFGVNKAKRFDWNSKNGVPGPATYNIKWLMDGKGFIYSSKLRSSQANSIYGKGKDLSTKFTNYISKTFVLIKSKPLDLVHIERFQNLVSMRRKNSQYLNQKINNLE